jgi:hypothetical protein
LGGPGNDGEISVKPGDDAGFKGAAAAPYLLLKSLNSAHGLVGGALGCTSILTMSILGTVFLLASAYRGKEK